MDVQEPATGSDEARARALAAAAALTLPGQRVRDKLAAGVPLLHDEDVRIDPEIVHSVWREGLRHVSRSGLDGAEHEIDVVQHALDTHRLHAEHATAEALAGHFEHVRAIAVAAGAPARLVDVLANEAAQPILRGYSERLGPALALGEWQRGYCPICGAWPWQFVRAASGGPGRLLCGRCGTGWSWYASECPFCGGHGTLVRLGQSDQLLGCLKCRTCLRLVAPPVSDAVQSDSTSLQLNPPDGASDTTDPVSDFDLDLPIGVGFRLELRGGEEPEWDAFDDD